MESIKEVLNNSKTIYPCCISLDFKMLVKNTCQIHNTQNKNVSERFTKESLMNKEE